LNSKELGEIELKKFVSDAHRQKRYTDAVEALVDAGIVALLRRFGRPYTPDGGANPYAAAYSAAFCEGYNKALDDLMYFDEQYIAPSVKSGKMTATFGALELALSRKDITPKEYEELKNGRKR
jgi:hypothetical protein